jgi:ketosteroid isomerase-like protein
MPVENKKLIQKINEAFTSGNIDFVLAHLEENIKWNIIGMPAITGKNNFLKAVKMFELGNFPSANIKNIIAEGEYIVVESTMETSDNVQTCSPAYCDIYRFRDGKIQELTTYVVDTAMNDDIDEG